MHLVVVLTLAVLVAGAAFIAYGTAAVRASGAIKVTGTVTDQSGDGVASVSVTATNPGDTSAVFEPVVTAANGTYQLDVDAGTYDFHFAPQASSGLAAAIRGNVTVTTDQTIDLQLVPASHTFSGTLRDAGGNPISNASLFFPLGAGGVSGSTNTAGHFSLTIRAGEYPLNLSIADYSGYPESVNVNGPPIDLRSGDVTQDLRIPLLPVALTVLTKDGSGNSLSNVFVTATPDALAVSLYSGAANAQVQGIGSLARTDASGASAAQFFDGATFPAGRICANFGGSDGVICNTNSVTLNGATTVTLAKTTAHTLSGVLSDADGNPLPNVTLQLPLSQVSAVSSVTDTNGYFSITIKPGVYSLIGSAVDITGYPQSVNINGPSFDLTNADIVQNLQLPLRSASLTVQARDANGNPAINLPVGGGPQAQSINLFVGGSAQVSGNSLFARTDTAGNTTALFFEGAVVGAGSLCINFGSIGVICNTDPVTITANTVVSIGPANNHTFSGTLTNAAGTPSVGATVSLQAGVGGLSATTDLQGHFSLTAQAGTYTLGGSISGQPNYPESVSFTGASINLNDADLTQSLQIPLQTAELTVLAKDGDGNPIAGLNVSGGPQALLASLYAGAPNTPIAGASSFAPTGSDGSTHATFFKDSLFPASSVCANFGLVIGVICNATPVSLTNDATILFQQAPAVPVGPTGLSVSSPTKVPVLSWNAVPRATTYNIYRGTVKIASTSMTTYTDNTAPESNQSYHVTAANASGESGPSNTVSVVVDRTPPTIAYSVSPPPNTSGWNNSNVTVSFACADNLAGIQACSSPLIVSSESATVAATGTVTDKAGNKATITATVKLDKTVPTAFNPTISTTFFLLNGNANISAAASDTLSGVVGGEYYIDTDPGKGSGRSMSYAGGRIAATAPIQNLSIGQHTLYMRSKDVAGNWSAAVSVNFTFL